MSLPKSCFVISPIGEEDSDTRRRSDLILKHVIRPAVSEKNYLAVRADEIDQPGIITSQVIQHIVNDDLVVADLTERNPNVFYELAVRHVIKKPLIQIIRKGDQIPFDVANTRTIYVDHKDLDSVEGAKTEIKRQIDAMTGSKFEIETPISLSLELQNLRSSGKPEERSLADIVSALSEIRTIISKIDARGTAPSTAPALEQLVATVGSLSEKIESRTILTRKRRIPIDEIRFLIIDLQMSTHTAKRDIALLIVGNYFKDTMPWVSTLFTEAYRASISKNKVLYRSTLISIKESIEIILNHTFLSELIENKRDLMFLADTLINDHLFTFKNTDRSG